MKIIDTIGGFFLGAAFVLILITLTPRKNKWYEMGVKETHKEAFAQGLMIKEIDKDDNVIYRWIETHKDNYYNEQENSNQNLPLPQGEAAE